MRKITILAVLAVMLTPPACAQKKEAEAKPSPAVVAHPWQGKRVAYFGDSIIDPNTTDSDSAFYVYLKEWLDQATNKKS